jgi:hypothetical protein
MNAAALHQADEITFQVAEVALASEPLGTLKTKAAAEVLLRRRLEAASDYTDDCVANITGNPLIYAAKFAHSQHRPLVLTPDMIWLTLCQGLVHHADEHWDSVSKQIVKEQFNFNRQIVVPLDDFPMGSAESDWSTMISEISDTARLSIRPEFSSLFTQTFSTSTATTQVALDVAFLSAVQQTFMIYPEAYICGIPAITLKGTASDWRAVREGIERFTPFGLEWWVQRIRTILEQFERAANSDVDVQFWKGLYHKPNSDGFCREIDYVTGWITLLFPYLEYGKTYRVNREFKADNKHPEQIAAFPSGVRKVSMRSQGGTVVNLIGGLIGIRQNPETMALEPKTGWLIQRLDALEQIMERLHEDVRCHDSPGKEPLPQMIRSPELRRFYERFADLVFFYREGDSKSEYCRFDSPYDYPLEEYADGTIKIATLGNGDWIGCRENRSSNETVASYVLGHCADIPVHLTNSLSELLKVIFHNCKTNESLRSQSFFI